MPLKEKALRKMEEVEEVEAKKEKKIKSVELTEEKVQELLDAQAELIAGMFCEIEDRLEENTKKMFDDQYTKIIKQMEHYNYRIYNSVKVEVRRQLADRGQISNG